MLSLFSCKRFLTPSFKANTKKNQMDAKLLLFHEVVTSVKQGVFSLLLSFSSLPRAIYFPVGPSVSLVGGMDYGKNRG